MTEFNRRVPVLLGTNVMEAYQMHLKNKFGANYIQKSKVSTPWKLGFQCLNAQARVADKVGQLVSSKPVCIPADATVQVKGLIKASCPQEILVCTEEENFPQLPSGLMLTPSVHSVDFTIGSKHSMSVEVRNFTQHDITLPANSIVCGVFPAKIHHVVNCHHTNISSSTSSEMSEFLEQFKIGTSLSESEEAQVNCYVNGRIYSLVLVKRLVVPTMSNITFLFLIQLQLKSLIVEFPLIYMRKFVLI